MEMELGIGTEEFLNDASHIAKGKRTKRHKPFSPCDVSSSSANDSASFSSTTTFQDEEQDMANCLILLAQGKTGGEETDDDEEDNKMMREKSRRISEVTTTATTKIGFYIYECKTCNRTFPSFQALGGHRASHKKPKVTSDDKKKPQQQPQPNTLALITNCDFEETKQARVMTTSPPISLQLGYGGGASNNNNGKPKIHECSICGSEFTSGQALGGHMRRHRTAVITTTSPQPTCDVPTTLEVVKPPRNLLKLDLNLPAPVDDDHHRDSQFQFSATQKTMLLSAAPPLVDCHY